MHTGHFRIAIFLLTCISVVTGHLRIKLPKPLAAPPENPSGNHYNAPLSADGSQFPCKGLHKRSDVSKTPTETWQAGQQTRFEILGHGATGGEGNMAAHSGESCQASLSFDNGETWKVLHSFVGGCPRGVALGSNMGSNDQTFRFVVPANTKAGDALFSFTWIAVSGNRNEYYQNCASVRITGSGTSTLDDLPDMFVGDMSIPGHIGPGECRSTAGYALEFPNPGAARTVSQVPNIGFRQPTGGKCYAKASGNRPVVPVTTTTTRPSPTVTTTTTRPLPTVSSIFTSPMISITTSKTPIVPGQLPSQCTAYMSVTDGTRHSSHPSSTACDRGTFQANPTWVRFSGAAGTRLVSGPLEPFRCNTQGAGWYQGSHPTVNGATVDGKVCYSWPDNSCQWSNSISITKCNDYYVYALPQPPACYLRYCTV